MIMKKLFGIQTAEQKVFNVVLNTAKELEKSIALLGVADCERSMEKIVPFFNITSPVHDSYVRPKIKTEKEIAFLDSFERFLKNTGRNEFGWNRTKKGELCTPENVYINPTGHLDEFFYTKTVSHYLSKKNETEKVWMAVLADHVNGKYNETGVAEIVFVKRFIENNYKFLCSMIAEYEKN